MDPNIKLILNELMKLRTEMKEGFVSKEVAFTKRLDDVTTEDHIRDARITNLEELVARSTNPSPSGDWRSIGPSPPSRSSSQSSTPSSTAMLGPCHPHRV
jgi:hypothetical protein